MKRSRDEKLQFKQVAIDLTDIFPGYVYPKFSKKAVWTDGGIDPDAPLVLPVKEYVAPAIEKWKVVRDAG